MCPEFNERDTYFIQAHLEWAKHDLSKITDRTIPDWVNAAIYGTALIFSSFAFVRYAFLNTFTPL
jgi:hypothetical protein